MIYVSYTPERSRSYRYCIEFGPEALIRYNICKTVIFTAYNQYIYPIMTEISTHKYWENVFILLFVWLSVIGFRQNHFHILPNYGDFGAKMSFFSLYNQPKTENVYKPPPPPPPPVFQNTTYIRNVYPYNKQSVEMGSWNRGGDDVLQTKNGKGPGFRSGVLDSAQASTVKMLKYKRPCSKFGLLW